MHSKVLDKVLRESGPLGTALVIVGLVLLICGLVTGI